ncbi:MAG TPA: alpha/beta fold hydrolase, partial [Chloroflexota bacterium]|nr:alpha/beta fold hydrolase [Chloroflexota bacterium]
MARTQYRPLQQEVWVNGQPIVYEASGSPEPLVLLHGLAGSSRWWSGSVPALSRHYQVFLIDLPGFGRLAHH